MFGLGLRILDVRERDAGRGSLLGTMEGLPRIRTHVPAVERVEMDLRNAWMEDPGRRQEPEATRPELDDFPNVSISRLHLVSSLG